MKSLLAVHPKVYISYSWQPDSLLIADTIDEDWKEIGLVLTRDKRDIGFKTSLREFMCGMPDGDYILVIISQGYLESENCMYEALELFQHPDFKNKILPIIAPSANIYSVEGLVHYIEYWENKIADATEQIKKLSSPARIKGIIEKLEHYQRIRDSIDSFSSVIRDMRGSSWPDIKKQNYEEIFKYIGYDQSNVSILEECRKIINMDNEEEQELALEALGVSSSQNYNVLATRASIAYQAKKYKKNKIIMDKILSLFPDNWAIHFNYAVLLHGRQEGQIPDLVKSLQHYKRAIELNPNHTDSYINLGLLLERDFHDYVGAREKLNQALAIDPNNIGVRGNLARLLTKHFQEYEEAIQHYEHVLTIEPNDLNTLIGFGSLLEILHNHEKAKQQYDLALAIDSNYAAAHYNLAMLLSGQSGGAFSDYIASRQHYEQLLVLEPRNSHGHNNFGVLLKNHFHDYKGAFQHYEQAILIDPKDYIAHDNIANLSKLEPINDYEKAKVFYEKALEINPSYLSSRIGLALLLWHKFHDYEGARYHYEQALISEPNDYNIHYNLASLLGMHLADFKESKGHFEQALTLNPNHTQSHHNLATLLASCLHDYEGAKKHYEQALQINPNLVETHVALADVLATNFNDFAGAKNHYEQALVLEPGNMTAAIYLSMLLSRGQG
jgi:tetratricopeptide (TPR) repeat protein